ncbi:arabinogalactan oligomer / maltooligosaccharide transport system substrate-binding protein [Lachnospiraceae bacterium C7]|nr:arabinogalactan oligomer / maltooligosaccharide transport system substrate-binding protein [Lachnospiraceae bacterium C7]
MKRKVLPLLLAGTMAASMFAGCSSEGSSSESKGESKDGAVTLTVMGPTEDQAKESGQWLQKECKAFAKEHPEWKINFKYQKCSEGDAKDTIVKDVDGAADVYMFANDQITDLVKANAISKLGGDTAKYVKDSNAKTIVNTVTYNGEIYGVPYTSNSWFMYYDKRVFSEDDVKNLDTMLTKGKVSFPISNGWYLAAFYTANDCTFYGDGTDEKAKIDFSEKKAAPVTKYLMGLMKNENFKPDTTDDGSQGLSGMKDGSVNAFFDGNWNYGAVCEAIGEENVGTAQLPTIKIDGQEKQMKSFLGSKAIGVNPTCKRQDIAVALAKYLGSEKAQKDHFDLRQQAPVNKNLTGTDEVKANVACDALAKVAENTSICQPIFGMQNFWDAAKALGKEIAGQGDEPMTEANYVEKTEAFNKQINTSVVK